MSDLKVQPSAVDGWDVVNADDGLAITNYPSREQAEEAARRRAAEDSLSAEGKGSVIVDTEHQHGIDDERTGILAAVFSLTGLLVVVIAIAVMVALIAALTGFGS